MRDARFSALPPAPLLALRRLEAAGWEAWLVGGCVRDALRGARPLDFDLTTNAPPAQVAAVFALSEREQPGLAYGSVRLRLQGCPLEITTYRREGDYTDGRHPDSLSFCTRIEEDLLRRDFTVNAMAWHPERGLFDPCGGQEDWARRRLVCVGDPVLRFSQDALRLLRALRFCGQLAVALSPETEAAACQLAGQVARLSPAAVWHEAERFLLSAQPEVTLRRHGDVSRALGEQLLGCAFPRGTGGTMLALLEQTPPRLALRLAALLQLPCARPPREVLQRLGCPRRLQRQVCLLQKAPAHLPLPAVRGVVWRRLRQLGRDDFFLLLDYLTAAARAKPGMGRRGPALDEARRQAQALLRAGVCLSPRNLDLRAEQLQTLGYTGKKLGFALEFLVGSVMLDKIDNKSEALLRYLRENHEELARAYERITEDL